MPKTKLVGKRRQPECPAGFHARADRPEREIEAIHPWPRPRGFALRLYVLLNARTATYNKTKEPP